MGMWEDAQKHSGTSSKGEKLSVDDATDIEEGENVFDYSCVQKLGKGCLKRFCRNVATSFFKEYGLISHQINSYNDFIKHGLQKVFDSLGEIIVEPVYDPSKKTEDGWLYASVRFGKVTLSRPAFRSANGDNQLNMLPKHARLQNMSYSSRMNLNIEFQLYRQKLVTSDHLENGSEQYPQKELVRQDNKEIMIGMMPVMVRSDLCWMNGAENGDCDFDHGGYFLIKGSEKVFIAQEQPCMTRLWISNTQGWFITYKSEIRRNRVVIRLEENSEFKDFKGGKKVIRVYFLSMEIPVWILFSALGFSSDTDIINLIDFEFNDDSILNIMFSSIRNAVEKCDGFHRGNTALNYLRKLLKDTRFPPEEDVEECITMYLFPALHDLKQKACFLGYMIKCLLQTYTGRRKCDNRDDFRNKRLELVGELLERELKVHVGHARRRMAKALQRDLNRDCDVRSISYYLDSAVVTNGLSRAFSTGSWSHPFKRNQRISGVVANLGRTNALQTMVDLRKMCQQVLYTGKVGGARYPHLSHWGRACFLGTPDGENCGLVKNLAITGLVSINILEPIIEKLFDCGMEKLENDTYRKDKVFLNGNWVGVCDDSLLFASSLRRKRRRKELPHQVEIKCDIQQGEVRIFSDPGRILRPLLVVENLNKIKTYKRERFTFQSLLEKGIIELVGTEEEEDCLVAWGIDYLFENIEEKQPVKYTHCELDMSYLLALSCGIIPFANHNHAKRVLYQSQKHSKQAIGISTTNPKIRCDTLSHQLYYPQKPLFRTLVSDLLGQTGYSPENNAILPRAELYNGQNAIVAINVHYGYNQEDSLVMNRASIERGMFRSEHFKSYKADADNKEMKKKHRKSEDVNFEKTEKSSGYEWPLEDDGLPFIGAKLHSRNIVIGRWVDSEDSQSTKLKHTEGGVVQKVVLSSNDEGKNFAMVSLRQVRWPSLGDKFSSMHGQKGVVGFLESQENFPFTAQGIVPDIVINPHAFPSRQTPGQILEAALGKGIACGGLMRYATPYSTPCAEAIGEQLHRAGFSRWGVERVYSGRTGEMVPSLIFMGPNFYQRLTHMAADKVKYRTTGPINPMTRQPIAERNRHGGIKFGEMERDCLLAHGASGNLYERFLTLSDPSKIYICQKCKNVANVVQRTVTGVGRIKGPYCKICCSKDDIVRVMVPHGAKLLTKELFSMGIHITFQTQIG